MRKSSNDISEITEESFQAQESPSSKFQKQYQLTLNYFLDRPLERKDIIKALPHTLEIIETLADKLLDPNKKIEFKELSKLTTKELTEIKDSLNTIDQRECRPQAPIFDAVKKKCTEIIDTLITNKEETKKNRNFLFSAVRKFSRFMGRSQTSDLSPNASKTIDKKFTEIKNILAPQSEIDGIKTDEQIANILKDNTDKLRDLNAVGAQNSGGTSSGGMSAEANLTFGASRAKANAGPAKSEPNTTLAGPNLTAPSLTAPSLTSRQIEIADELRKLKPSRSTPSNQPLKSVLPTLKGRRPQSTGGPSTSPSSPNGGKSLVDQVMEKLDPDSTAGKRLKDTTQDLINLGRKHAELRRRQQERRAKRKPGKGGRE
jgi:hypothetical protein